MMRGGDEYGATQRGNNNEYCQDNEISWLSWNRDAHARRLTEFTSKLIRYRLSHPIFHQPHFFKGHDIHGIGMKDLTWINADGNEMDDEAWNTDFAKVIGLMLCGDAINLFGFKGEPITDGTFLIYFNAHHEDIEIAMASHSNVRWRLIIDTTDEAGFVENGVVREGGAAHTLTARSLAMFEQQGGTADEARDVRGRRMISEVRAAVRNAAERVRGTIAGREPPEKGTVL